MAKRPRIVILGGGVGAVTSAFQLSKGDWQERFESITLYQQGWRLGGKGASGRGPDLRIEEHGLHIWFGFYENAFRMMRECHEELDSFARRGISRWPLAFDNVQDSFRPCSEISLTDYDGCEWKLWTADFFDYNDDKPWLPRRARRAGTRRLGRGVLRGALPSPRGRPRLVADSLRSGARARSRASARLRAASR